MTLEEVRRRHAQEMNQAVADAAEPIAAAIAAVPDGDRRQVMDYVLTHHCGTCWRRRTVANRCPKCDLGAP